MFSWSKDEILSTGKKGDNIGWDHRLQHIHSELPVNTRFDRAAVGNKISGRCEGRCKL